MSQARRWFQHSQGGRQGWGDSRIRAQIGGMSQAVCLFGGPTSLAFGSDFFFPRGIHSLPGTYCPNNAQQRERETAGGGGGGERALCDGPLRPKRPLKQYLKTHSGSIPRGRSEQGEGGEHQRRVTSHRMLVGAPRACEDQTLWAVPEPARAQESLASLVQTGAAG